MKFAKIFLALLGFLTVFVVLSIVFVNWKQPDHYLGVKLSETHYTHRATTVDGGCNPSFTYVGFPVVNSYGLCAGDSVKSDRAVWLDVLGAFAVATIAGGIATMLVLVLKKKPKAL